MGKFLDFIGKAANIVGGIADVGSQFIPGLSKVANIAKGVGGIANAYSTGKGQREAISGFVGDMFGSKWGNLANTAIGAGEQIFKAGKATAKGMANGRNVLGTLQAGASGIGRITNILGNAAGSLGRQMNSMGGRTAAVGQGFTDLSRGISTANQYGRRVADVGNQLHNAVRTGLGR